MMVKVLVIGSRRSGKKNDPSIIAAAVGGRVGYWEDVNFIISTGSVKVTLDGEDLLDDAPELVIAVGWYKNGKYAIYRDLAYTLSLVLDFHNIPYWNKEMGLQRSTTKLSCLVGLALRNIPVTSTCFSLNNHNIENAEVPFVAKAVAASRGESNYLVSDEHQRSLINKNETYFLVQPFLPNDHDLRVICFGGIPALALRRSRSQGSSSHLNNVSTGAAGEWIPIDTLPSELLTKSSEICKIMGRELAGIDFIPDSTSPFGYSCLEVNAIPQLTSGHDVQYKMDKLQKIIESYTS